MAITAAIKRLLNNLTPGAKKSQLGDLVEDLQAATQSATTTTAGIVKQGVTVAAAAGSTPTKAEFDALVTSLKNAGVIATS